MKQRMPEFKESTAFKLFGKTISILQLSLDQEHDGASCADNEAACQDCSDRSSSNSEEEQERKDGNLRFQEPSVELIPDEKQEEGTPNQVDEDSKDPILLSVSENLKTPSAEGETSSIKSCKNGEQSDSSTSDEKTLKKPDKIIPCPRCSSMETKFCYYNNYNVNQPRHFCKNCQRYWTAGGTMRNVPMGAGRRKNKSSATAQYRHHLMVSEALRTVQAHALSGVHNSSFGNNSTVLNFGSDSPLCESVASALSISHKAHSGATDWNNRPSECSVLSLNSLPKGGNDRSQEAAAIENCQGFPPQLQCFPGPAWPCPWNPAMPPPTFGPSGFPVSFYSAPRYWGYAVPDPRNISALNHCAPVRSPKSPLGKHSRDGEVLNPGSSEELSRESNSDKTVFVPKTLRIDDPSEAAMSSIWGTLGIKHEKSSSMNGGLFKGFQSISKEKYLTERSSLLQANPAAMSRSQNFHEIL